MRWEYEIFRCDRITVLKTELNRQGAEGWELVSIIEREGYLQSCFKREIPEPTLWPKLEDYSKEQPQKEQPQSVEVACDIWGAVRDLVYLVNNRKAP